ncbi:MAG: hypothetical protein IPL60_00010 [Ardenticatenia bacterium]|nr:hypothetical protein [Ardenticatenia bacterium]
MLTKRPEAAVAWARAARPCRRPPERAAASAPDDGDGAHAEAASRRAPRLLLAAQGLGQ